MILLFGSNGMLGRYVFKKLSSFTKIVAINRCDFDIFKDEWVTLHEIISQNKDSVIINCCGIIPQKFEQKNENLKMYIRVNTLFPHKLAEFSKEFNCKLIHITTDCVYDGTLGNYKESESHNPSNIYGTTKSLGEPENVTVIRTSIIGEELNSKKSLIEWLISRKKTKINGFKNHYWNGITCLTLANIIEKIIRENIFWNGVKHIFSPDSVSKYELCKYINEIYNLEIEINEFEDDQSRNMTLSSNYKNIFEINDIYSQIKEQQNFKII